MAWTRCSWALCLLLTSLLSGCATALQQPLLTTSYNNYRNQVNRRHWIQCVVSTAFLLPSLPASAAPSSAPPPDLKFTTAPSGLQWADAKVGTGEPITKPGAPVSIDYVMSTSGARYGSKIYSTVDSNAPYRFRLGDATTIAGLQEAIAGGEGVEPMRPGGIRRIIVPSNLAYESLAKPVAGMQYQDCQEGRGVGPIPPAGEGNVAEYYQRFKNIYCNTQRAYQPDLVMDVKLYGKR